MNKFKNLVRTVCSALCASFLATTVNAEDVQKIITLNANEFSSLVENINETTNNELINLVGDPRNVNKDVMADLRASILDRVSNEVVSSEFNDPQNNTGYLMPMDQDFLIVNKDGEETGRLQGIAQESCIICLNEFEDGEYNALLPCGHRLHIHCLGRWAEQESFCPVCKRSFEDRSLYISQFKKQAEQDAHPDNGANNDRIEQNEQNNDQNFADNGLNDEQILGNEIDDPANENRENENNRVYDEQNFEFKALNVGNVYDFCRLGGVDSVSNIAQEVLFGNGLLDKNLQDNLPAEFVLKMHRKNIYLNGACGLCNKSISPNSDEPAVIADCNGDHCSIFHLGCLRWEASKSHAGLLETLRKPGMIVFMGRNLDAFENSLNELRELLGM